MKKKTKLPLETGAMQNEISNSILQQDDEVVNDTHDEPEHIKVDRFLSHFHNSKFRYYGDNKKPSTITMGNSDTRRPEWNDERYQNSECFTVNGFTGGQKDEHIDVLNAFFIDIDWNQDITDTERTAKISELYMDMDGMDCAPSYIIETKKGCHCYWILKTPVRKDALTAGQWETAKNTYEGILTTLTRHWGADLGAKSIGRILRIPGSLHWKNPEQSFKIKFFAEGGMLYEWATIEKLFPPQYDEVEVRGEFPKVIATELERLYPRLSRPSSQALLKTSGGHIPVGLRNKSLHAISTILRDSGVPLDKAIAMFSEYHGIVEERGIKAARNTIRSAYAGKCTYGNRSDVIAPHVTPEERDTIATICKKELRAKKESDLLRYAEFEHEILAQYPDIRKDATGRWYQYENGVYVSRSDEWMISLVMRLLEAADLSNHKTRAKVLDKLACFSSLLPPIFNPDSDPNILNVHNGLLNIRTLDLSPHTPSYDSISQLPFDYMIDAKSPRWEKFIGEVTRGEAGQARLLRQFAGYCLTNDTKYHKALILVGGGSNGKSVFSSMLTHLLGNQNTSAYSIDQINGRFGLAGLYGKRLNIIEEVKEGYYESDIIKKLISGESVSAEIKMKQDALNFRPTTKLLFCVNSLPRLQDTSDGAFRRFIIIEFSQRFGEEGLVADPNLGQKLREELPGILVWSLGGLADLVNEQGFTETQRNKDAIEEYKKENSGVREFVAEKCVIRLDGREDRDKLYEQYGIFITDCGGKSKGRTGFVRELKSLGYRTVKRSTTHGYHTYDVLGLTTLSHF